MHASEDPRLLRSFDALKMSFAILDEAHSALYPACVHLAEKTAMLPAVVGKAWLCVDTVHRIRELAQGVRGLSNERIEVAEMLAATSAAEGFRHYMQHLRREVLSSPPNNFPVWGALTWLDPHEPKKTHTVLAGASSKGVPHIGPAYDFVSGGYASKVTLTVGELTFEFDRVHEAIRRFESFVLPWIRETYKLSEIREEPPVIASVQLLGITSVDA